MWESMGGGDPVGVGGRMCEIHMGKTHCTHVWTSKNKFKSLKIAKSQQSGQQLRNSATFMTRTNMPTCRNSSLSHTNVL